MALFFNRVTRVWVVDLLDYFLISVIIGSFGASYLKKYLSEKAVMERLKNSIITKSKLVNNKNTPMLNSKEVKIQKIYRFALGNRGGQFEEFQADPEIPHEVLQLAQGIKGLVERLAVFLKERELKGIGKIFFKQGRLWLELVLRGCSVNIAFITLTQGLSTQVIVATVTAGGVIGFTVSWFSVGASLVTPPLLISALLLRSAKQQFLNQREYLKFKKMLQKVLDDEELKETIRVFFTEGDVSISISDRLKMKSLDVDKNSALKYDFNLKSSEDLDDFIKLKMKDELGLIKNPTEIQLDEFVQRKMKTKPKGKTVFLQDLVDKLPYEGADLPDSEIINAKILEEPIRIKLDNEL